MTCHASNIGAADANGTAPRGEDRKEARAPLERMNSPLEIREIRLRGLQLNLSRGFGGTWRVFDPEGALAGAGHFARWHWPGRRPRPSLRGMTNPVFVFETTHHALWAEEVAQEARIPAEVIPAPPAARARCNLALETLPEDAARLADTLTAEGVPHALWTPAE